MVHSQCELLEKLNNLRDIGDFCIAWPELKALISDETISNSDLPVETKQIVYWLKLLADKVVTHPI